MWWSLRQISRNSRLVHEFLKELLIEFHENPTDFLVADTRSRAYGQMDGRKDVVSTYGVPFFFFYFVNEAEN